ncbi:hypothetical protein EK21DRAFT_112529 [Setomelanomma holmii]|uniref:Uncharacterized protein n=1 Tax=Setomelanomma holmii TaxID=210430 RepID=A0A9P4H8X9_9PLEO|nr:hypothetical protein EK21DRAFT_112529 [Setomelanomma holmii]
MKSFPLFLASASLLSHHLALASALTILTPRGKSNTADDGRREYNAGGAAWNVCYVGGRPYLTDPRIGDFSITFKECDGSGQGEGLTTPILQLNYVGNWSEIPVQTLAEQYHTYQRCSDMGGLGGSVFRDCDKGPFICHWSGMGNSDISVSRTKGWECSLPKIGRGCSPGWCGIYVTQYQKPDPAKDKYALEVAHLNDANENREVRPEH